jgi:hypothetical protein
VTALRQGTVQANGFAFPTLEAGPASGGMDRLHPGGVRRVVVDGAGHFLHFERPEVGHRAIVTFLAVLPEPAAPGGWRRLAAGREDDSR